MKALAPQIAGQEAAVGLLRELAHALEAAGVSYCHWKGNARPDGAGRAGGDVDLLVRRADIAAFTSVLSRLGFKESLRPDRDVPGVVSYYGYDQSADELVHLHVHYQLVFGNRTANYRVPLERQFLAGASAEGMFPVPPPELEYIVFVIRMMVKHCTWGALLLGDGTLPPRRRQELTLLRARVDSELVDRSLEQRLPAVDSHLFADCARALDPGGGIWFRIRTGRRLLGALHPYTRRDRAGSVRRRLSRSAPRKRLVGGGAVIAVVGGDGGGKSTLVDALYEWLGKDFSTRKVHLGKPASSWTRWLARGALKVRALLLTLRGRDRHGPSGGRLLMLLALATARDRYRTYVKAQRFALNGGFVVSDRFPVPQLTLMDAPRIERWLDPAAGDRFGRRLSWMEQRYYRRIAPPDLLIVLRVDPETAVARKPEEREEFVRGRSREIWAVDWENIGAHVVDASRPAAQVLAEVKAVVWSEV